MKGRFRLLLGLAAISGLVGVAAGAFGEHGEPLAAPRDWLKTGAEYGMIHALGVFASYLLVREGSRSAEVAAWLFLAGGIVFSWSLDLMAITGQPWLGMITPVGGPLMLAAWLVLAFAAFRGVRKPKS
jgi:uncharacterized membrane protein YgdD (TMEM256/DUF423 family)